MKLIEASYRIGNIAWSQATSFEIVGSWVTSESNANAKLQFFSQALRQGRHAKSLVALLPKIADLSPEDFLLPESSKVSELFDGLRGLVTTQERLTGLYLELMPMNLISLRNFLADSKPISDMPFIRQVAEVLADEEQDLGSGLSLLAGQKPR
jgi:hypothetical protein